jgi:hypothetical protein
LGGLDKHPKQVNGLDMLLQKERLEQSANQERTVRSIMGLVHSCAGVIMLIVVEHRSDACRYLVAHA